MEIDWRSFTLSAVAAILAEFVVKFFREVQHLRGFRCRV